MLVRSTLSPSEFKEATTLLRPKYFWLRFFGANWYSTLVCGVLLVAAVNALVNHNKVHWDQFAGIFAVFAAFIGYSWFRYNSAVDRSLDKQNALYASIELEEDGVHTSLRSGGTIFLPWNSFSKWQEGKSVFLLTCDSGCIILPCDAINATTVRTLLQARIR